MSNIARIVVGTFLTGIVVLMPAIARAEGFTYDLVLTAKFETGVVGDLPGLPVTDFSECKYRKSKIQLGRKFPRGTIVTPGGNTPSGIIIGARCVQRIPKMGE